ncbi:MAG: multicopper oxidase family protein, partial [Pseudomonadota bacterium]
AVLAAGVGAATAIGAHASGVGHASAAPGITRLRAEPGIARLLGPDGQPTAIWGFDGAVPGPELRVRQGAELAVRFQNGIDQPATIHWHGIRIDNAMDGVPGMTQRPVLPGEDFDYRFVCPDAGTYWYHPHKGASEQVGRGLYGALIVEERDPIAVDHEQVLLLDDWRLTDAGEIHTQSFGAMHDRAHAGRYGNALTINGKAEEVISVRSGARVRLRLINVANANIFGVRVQGHAPMVVAYDGHPVMPRPAPDGIVLLGPAQRVDLVFDAMAKPGSAFGIDLITRRETRPAGRLVYVDESPLRTAPLTSPIALAPNPMPQELDLANALTIDLPMEGGARSRMAGAMHHGTRMSLRELVREKGYAWALAGHAGMPTEPLFRAKRGQTVRLNLANETFWPHAMHVHGHHFREVGSNASEDAWRDTIMLFRQQKKSIAFVADNPGRWMLHCHMLEHHEAGMGTWFEVA